MHPLEARNVWRPAFDVGLHHLFVPVALVRANTLVVRLAHNEHVKA